MDRVFHGVRHLREFTVADLTDIVPISRTTVRKALNTLLTRGIVEGTGKRISTDEGGKRPAIYAFRPNAKFVLALHIGSKALYGRITNLSSEVLVERSRPITFDLGIETLLSTIEIVVESLLNDSRVNGADVLGLAFGTHGVTDFEQGVVVRSPHNPSWGSYLHLRKLIEERLRYAFPVFVDNTVRFRALAEVAQGALRNSTNGVVLHTSEGVIAGLIQNGRLYRGPHNLAGSIGHLIVNLGDAANCACGGTGCFEMQVRPARVLERSGIAISGDTDSEERLSEILAALPNQPQHVRDAIEDVATWFAVLFHNLIVMWDPDVIVLQGVYARAHESFLEAIRERMNAVSLLGVQTKTKVVSSTLGENAAEIGAVSYVISHTVGATQ